jgi:hypothetical protein
MKSALFIALLGLVACGGSKAPTPPPGPQYATGLDYQDPSGSGWRLVRDPSSTTTRLVLNLVGPSGVMTRGAGFNLTAPNVRFGAFGNGLPIADTGVYQLRRVGSVDPNEPVALNGAVKGNLLTVGIWQKDRDQGAKDSGAALAQIALVYAPQSELISGTAIPLQIVKAKVIPEQIGTVNDPVWLLTRELKLADISIAVGTLTAL